MARRRWTDEHFINVFGAIVTGVTMLLIIGLAVATGCNGG